MEFHSALAESNDLEEACEAVASDVRRRLGDGPVDLIVVFASASYGADLDRLPVLLQEMIGAKTLVGCTGAGLLHQNTMSDKQHTPTQHLPRGADCCLRPKVRRAACW